MMQRHRNDLMVVGFVFLGGDTVRMPVEEYKQLYLNHILPYIADDREKQLEDTLGPAELLTPHTCQDAQVKHNRRKRMGTMRASMESASLPAQGMRALFVSILQATYAEQIDKGELEDRLFFDYISPAQS